MKRIFLLMMAAMLVSVSGYAQKYGYIYSEKVFKAMPGYQEALNRVEEYAKGGEEKVKSLYQEAQKGYDNLASLQSQLTESQFRSLAEAVVAKEREATRYNEEFFGNEGKLVEYRDSQMKPFENKVLTAVEAVAAAGGYDMIFDLSTVKLTVYQSPSLDLTQRVIGRLGL
ncbi:MAG: OmpH family outer membrane protein [Rikenellaceae bacterium]|nr:OmpH family outer membrane protein [Rikenellaceae bacterium]